MDRSPLKVAKGEGEDEADEDSTFPSMGSALGAARDSSDKISLPTISSHCPSATLRLLAASESFATNLKVAPTESKVLWSGG
jgi:hypothetical protein